MEIKRNYTSNIVAFVCNIALVYVAYAICRIEYLLENWSLFSESFFRNSWTDILTGCWMFDTSAILYTNVIYAAFMLFPLHFKESKLWTNICRWMFVILNSIFIAINIVDSVYFQYTGRRTTMSVFSEFSNEGNMLSIMGTEFLRHWYLVIFAGVLFYGFYRLYVTPKGNIFFPDWEKAVSILRNSLCLFPPVHTAHDMWNERRGNYSRTPDNDKQRKPVCQSSC